MSIYKITIAENISYKQYVGFVEADTMQEAKEQGKFFFNQEHPIYSAHSRIIMCHKMRGSEQYE